MNTATPILFLHGFPFNASCWKDQMDYFKTKRVVLAPDLRGHGSGPKSPGPWMIQDFVEDLHELLVYAKIEKIILCGVSLGGYIALEFINRYPEMVQNLILCSTRSDADSNVVKDQRYKTIERLRSDGLSGFADDFSKLVLSESKQGHAKTEQSRILKKQLEDSIVSNSPMELALVVGAMASRKDSTAVLKNITCPTLVITGDEDNVIPWSVTKLMANEIPTAEFVKVHHAGHLVNVEQSKTFNRLVDSFLETKPHIIKEATNGHTRSAAAVQH